MLAQIDKFNSNYGIYSRSMVKNLFVVLSSIIQAKTVNLYLLKDEMGKILAKYNIYSESHYRRLTRFFTYAGKTNLWASVLRYGLDLLEKDIKLLYLDGTEWYIGVFKLHILFLAVDYKGVAVPVYFKLYSHKGVLSEKERILFLEAAIAFLDLKDCSIIADREFIGDNWFIKFRVHSIDFIIRLRKNQYKSIIGEKSYKMLEKKAVKKKKSSVLIQIDGWPFRLWVLKNKTQNNDKEPLIYILTSVLDKSNVTDLYRLRWKIELLFKHFKSNGYNLEDLRMTNLDKIKLLIAILTLAYILAVLTAFDERKNKKMNTKTYKDGRKFDTISVFKQGQSLLKQSFITLKGFLVRIQFIGTSNLHQVPKEILFVQ